MTLAERFEKLLATKKALDNFRGTEETDEFIRLNNEVLEAEKAVPWSLRDVELIDEMRELLNKCKVSLKKLRDRF